jgi:hypothetical protein
MTDYKYVAMVIDRDGNFWRPFETLAEVVAFAGHKGHLGTSVGL